MAEDNCQKIKLLLIVEILRQETDEEHTIGTGELCRRLVEKGITCDRRTLSRDITTLNAFGYEVIMRRVGHENTYYMRECGFSVPELKILIDAVQAASFITPDKSDTLMRKIAALGGSHEAEVLMRNKICFNTRKHTNEEIYYIVEALEAAIAQKKKVEFFYFDLNENRERIYRRKKKRYSVNPMAMVFSRDNYYLLCYAGPAEGICVYRLDRMEKVEIIDEEVPPEAVLETKDVSEYTKQVFSMYGGPAENIVIRFDNSIIGYVYDKFGEDTKIIRHDDNTCVATVTVQISPTFWGWVFQFEGKLRIISPEYLADDLRKVAKAVADNSSTENETAKG